MLIILFYTDDLIYTVYEVIVVYGWTGPCIVYAIRCVVHGMIKSYNKQYIQATVEIIVTNIGYQKLYVLSLSHCSPGHLYCVSLL